MMAIGRAMAEDTNEGDLTDFLRNLSSRDGSYPREALVRGGRSTSGGTAQAANGRLGQHLLRATPA